MTTKTAHTPGPWYAHNLWLGPEGKGPYAYPLGTDPDEAAANAHLIAMAPRMAELTHAIADYQHQAWAENAEQQRAAFAEEARAILRALDTPDAPCPVSPGSKEPCPVCGPVKR